MDDFSVAPRTFAGDPFAYAKVRAEEKRLAELEERYAHELLSEEEGQELRDEWLRLRLRRLAKLGR